MTIYCPPHTPGQRYDTNIHGVAVRPPGHWDALYDHNSAQFSRFWQRNGFPLDVPVPREVFDLVSKAAGCIYISQEQQRASLLAEAHAALDAAAERMAQQESLRAA